MQLDEKKVVVAACLVAVLGIALLFLMNETPRRMNIAQALVSQENTLAEVAGTAENLTEGKFSLCDQLCISVRFSGIPSAYLLSDGRVAVVLGRIKEYRGNRYLEAERIDAK